MLSIDDLNDNILDLNKYNDGKDIVLNITSTYDEDNKYVLIDLPYTSLNNMDCNKYYHNPKSDEPTYVYHKDDKKYSLIDLPYNMNFDKNNPKYKSSETMIYKNVDVNDGVTNQIINTKRMSITFFVDKFSKNYTWTQIKYIDDVVMNYLTQLIPSTAIVDIKYKTR